MAQQLDEPLDSRIPEAFVGAKPVVGALERPRVDAAVVDSPTHGAFHESCPLEGLDVLRCRGERHLIRCRELTNGLLAFGEALEHRAASMVAERAEDEVESRLLIMFNHMVEHIGERQIVNRFVECFFQAVGRTTDGAARQRGGRSTGSAPPARRASGGRSPVVGRGQSDTQVILR